MPLPKQVGVSRFNAKKGRQPGLLQASSRLASVTAAREWTVRARSSADTDRLGRFVGQSLRGGEVVALFGELGTGKTALVRGIAAGLRAPRRAVTSPTFVLVHHYCGRLPLAHADLYRVGAVMDLQHIGLSEYLDGHTVLAVEWAERAGAELPPDRLEVHLSHRGECAREILLKACGTRSEALLNAVRTRAAASRRARGLRKRARPR